LKGYLFEKNELEGDTMAEQQTGSMLETRPGREETVNLMRAYDIRDIRVHNAEGETLGDISDIVIDRDSGCIAYAVLSHGGILGFGEKHFAIPWEAVRIRPGERTAIVDADKRTLDSSSGFSRDRMPREADWSLVRTPPPARAAAATAMAAAAAPAAPVMEREVPPSRAAETAAPVETTSPAGERVIPTPPPVQTVAAGWGGHPTTQRAEERPVMTEGPPPTGTGVKAVHRERTVETPPRETVVEEGGREPAAAMETRQVTEAERSLRTPGPSPGRLSAADLQTYLKGIDYPVGRADLVTHARQHGAPESVLTTLEGFPDRTYRSAADVSAEFGGEARARQPTGIGTPSGEIRETRARHPSLAHLSAADLQVYLKGMDYPAGREELAIHARKNNAPEEVISAIESFSDRTYHSAADVSTEFGREVRGEQAAVMETRREREIATEEAPVARRTAPSLTHLSAADLQVYLKGMDYPAGKQEIVAQARKNNAPEDVISAIESFSDRTYHSAADVSTEFGKIR
jgi:sporulation protein YlmC with PRC-barrel domain